MGVSMSQSFKHIVHVGRDFIQQQVSSARSYRSIAAALGRSVSAVSLEVARIRCDTGCYEAISAGNAARVRQRRGLVKLCEGSALREHVIKQPIFGQT
jgi:IS30 family transposase